MARPTALALRAGTIVPRYDVHTLEAAKQLNIDPADVTLEQRAQWKRVSFGQLYGLKTGVINADRDPRATS